jgi:hypothetical protein
MQLPSVEVRGYVKGREAATSGWLLHEPLIFSPIHFNVLNQILAQLTSGNVPL